MGGWIVLIVTFGLMWALLIRPQQRRVRAHQAVVSQLAVGEEVMTTAGIYGRLTEVSTDTVRVEVAPGVELKLARGAVASKIAAPEAAAAVDDEPAPPPAVQPRRGLMQRRTPEAGAPESGT